MNQSVHQSVLLKEAIEALQIQAGDTVVDATVGGAGHFAALLGELHGTGTLIGIDADAEAIARGKEAAANASGTKVLLVNDNFRNLSQILEEEGVESISKALFDLGWSSYHLTSGRGFSFRA